MNFNKKHLIGLIAVIVLAVFLTQYKLPYYIYKPGGADALNPIVDVADSYESKGDMHLVTISGGQATPLQYLWSSIMSNHEIRDLSDVYPEDVSKEEYRHAQLQMMENSQEASKVVAYEAADADIDIDYEGVYVANVTKNMPADGVLKSGDHITRINDQKVHQAEDMINVIDPMKAGDTVDLTIERDDETLTKTLELVEYKDREGKIGVGIGLVTDRQVDVEPEVTFSSGQIGGPSAGLMFSLEMYDQLTETDLTKGKQIAGTGQIDYDGNVLPIGGIDKKVVAADREGCDLFFAPNEHGASDSNYHTAKNKAEEIDTDMKIIPVDSFDEALDYIKDYKPAS